MKNNFLKNLFVKYINRPFYNVFGTDFKKKVLISYIVYPFRKNNFSRTNFFEVKAAAKIFHELNYQVDVVSYDGKIPDISKYDVIYGFGDVFQEYFENNYSKKITIYYGTGMHVCYQNNVSLLRVKEVYEKKKKWLGKSARFVDKTWTHQTSLVDGMVVLGNEVSRLSYERFFDGPIISIPAPFFQTVDPLKILSERQTVAKRSFLWFGSRGLIHKGLDLCLEFFSSRPDLTLHVCGDVFAEPEFVETYRSELLSSPNIFCYGFVSIESERFVEILKSCDFTIFPSCSEGGAPSVLTVIGNGALIPIVTRETTVSTGFEIMIESFSVDSLSRAVEYATSLTDFEVKELQVKNCQVVRQEHSVDNYYNCLKNGICEILNV